MNYRLISHMALASSSALLWGMLSAACNTAVLKDAPNTGSTSSDGGSPVSDAADGDDERPMTAPLADATMALPDAEPPPDAGKPETSTGIQIIVEPGDKAAGLIAAIGAAKSSVHMTMYLFTSTAVQNALIASKQKGRDVKVLLNQNFPANSGSNQAAFNALMSAGVQVKWAPSGFTLTHEKCVILDASTAWIMTMNTTQTSPQNNREYLAVDHDPADVAEAEAIFQADWSNVSFQPVGNLVVAPTNAGPRIKALVDSATATIDIEAEELSDYVTVNALVARLAANVEVRIVLADGTPSPAQQTAMNTLKSKNAKIVTLSTPYVHAKAMVVDGARAYVGSENFTASSLSNNRELGVIFNSAPEVNKVGSTIAADFAAGTAF